MKTAINNLNKSTQFLSSQNTTIITLKQENWSLRNQVHKLETKQKKLKEWITDIENIL